ncbi:hypothetical protein [Ornithobacterium rhinotracheale]|uniref:Uncharacterized protein n=1 Tax=Ornithobacterium rhinotracheale (strain ATCC 51463 / DSM 15997 / CCUG 23171 / CIP 104009 / LMG 9086) TaxID=867902 RepID=I4A383_ORNRL|nr:hypothetical protein [Ornithobacterium rhinotracheale]AFL98417.1 hypothetical protein Ornrh_2286 [Ornithobacterium rhinotracheale DSM 15997]AIQ00762.1 hypothetical protein Q785_11570 [Ornithobacterium rhinotracheale ORT-UMN 88]KGB65859.1 hypothetical protein Q787_11100 [Ornithobacterium rhinotracheale H06-030791]MCK0193236.1 hypothetical protein [Ornithobacterium rhinotracheale]MCK0201109.1 hypothetical protein [Ornithobacterium rhinotracheale]
MKKKTLFIIGVICSLIVAFYIALWIGISTQGAHSFEESVNLFNSYFPAIIDGTYLLILLSLTAIICFWQTKKKDVSTNYKQIGNYLMILNFIFSVWLIWTLL